MFNIERLNIEVLNVLFKVFQRHKFENPIPEDIIEIIKEYIDSRRMNVQFGEIHKKKHFKNFEIGWNQDDLLIDLVSLSAKLFEPQIEHFKEVHIETKKKWFLDNTQIEGKYEELNSKLELITEIILNQEKYLPGFKYFYEFELANLNEKNDKDQYSEKRHSGDLLFVSEAGVLAVVGVTHFNKINSTKNQKYIKDQIRKFKTFANKRFGNMFVAVIGLYVTNNQNDKIVLNPIDSFDKKIARNVKKFVKDKHDEESDTDCSSDSSYSDSKDSKEEISDSNSNDEDDDSSPQFDRERKFAGT